MSMLPSGRNRQVEISEFGQVGVLICSLLIVCEPNHWRTHIVPKINYHQFASAHVQAPPDYNSDVNPNGRSIAPNALFSRLPIYTRM